MAKVNKVKKAFFCSNCGTQSPKWVGKCPACNEWNTFSEEIVQAAPSKSFTNSFSSEPKVSKAYKISQIESKGENRLDMQDHEFNRVLGGGLVKGSITLIGGEPGIGKSTLLLQIALSCSNLKILYVSGEESERQIKMRAERIGLKENNCFILSETNTSYIFKQIESLQPDFVVIDSIQTLQTDHIDSAAGSISQIRETAAELQRFSKSQQVPVLLIGHINKDGNIAGPKILEHMVDTVLQFEGDRHYGYRILRSVKNRFGSTSELGIYEMNSSGLREISNPSEILLSKREEDVVGVAIAATVEGLRPLLIEVQALVSPTAYGMPQRSATGFDLRRLSMLLAIIERKCGIRLGTKDVFVNIAGGFKVDDPAIDLAVIAAILSSAEDIPVPRTVCLASEVGLTGEIRAVNRIEQRISEAEKLGFEEIYISHHNKQGLADKFKGIGIKSSERIEEVLRALFV
ncbi:MAG: DNA repair protein RadA [Bacteroidales bacterium]